MCLDSFHPSQKMKQLHLYFNIYLYSYYIHMLYLKKIQIYYLDIIIYLNVFFHKENLINIFYLCLYFNKFISEL